ncbi:MAG: hydrogenase expression/formation protein HypE [Chloroflexi bacterium]|nr:hydrogenase expression/formation protein HypE [Chloroflexota bacterium]
MPGPVCPVPLRHGEKIVMGHGSGGKMMADLIAKTFLPPLDNPALRAGNDAGVVEPGPGSQLAISTDCHVVSPLFFPGGDIGKLAICGTVNDVAMMGATPQFLTAGFILEEGLDLDILEKVVASMKAAAEEAGVEVVAGDTKVVQKGLADGLYITTSGVGTVISGKDISGAGAKPGDVVIVSGYLGDHGIAVLGARGELGFESDIQSDVAPLNHVIASCLNTSDQVRVLRDPTRGGVASALNEISQQSDVGITLFENAIPVRPAVAAACEMLGFDPLYIANEGKFIAIVGKDDGDKVLKVIKDNPYGEGAAIIGEVTETPKARVLMKTAIGGTRVVDVLAGEMLPRIC